MKFWCGKPNEIGTDREREIAPLDRPDSVSLQDWKVMIAAARARIVINERLTRESIPDWIRALAKAKAE